MINPLPIYLILFGAVIGALVGLIVHALLPCVLGGAAVTLGVVLWGNR